MLKNCLQELLTQPWHMLTVTYATAFMLKNTMGIHAASRSLSNRRPITPEHIVA
jgi:hypothetical protein